MKSVFAAMMFALLVVPVKAETCANPWALDYADHVNAPGSKGVLLEKETVPSFVKVFADETRFNKIRSADVVWIWLNDNFTDSVHLDFIKGDCEIGYATISMKEFHRLLNVGKI